MMRHVSYLSIFLMIISTDLVIAMDERPDPMDLEETQESAKQIHTPPQLKYSKKMQEAAKLYCESTPGTLSYEENKKAIIRCLQNYANPNIEINNPLSAAIRNGDSEFAAILIDYGVQEKFPNKSFDQRKKKRLKNN